MDNLITVHRFFDSIKLNIVKSSLENEGIKTYVFDDKTTTTLSVFEAFAIGGARLMVDENDYVRASEILIEIGIVEKNDNPQEFLIWKWIDKMAVIFPFEDKNMARLFMMALWVLIPFLGVVAWIIMTS